MDECSVIQIQPKLWCTVHLIISVLVCWNLCNWTYHLRRTV